MIESNSLGIRNSQTTTQRTKEIADKIYNLSLDLIASLKENNIL